MELQKGLYDKRSLLKHQIDLINKPKFVIDLLKEEFTDDKKELPLITNAKVENKKSNDKFGNERLYGVKKSNIDYDVLRKKNKLTEYICLIKAKNNFEMNNLNKKQEIEPLITVPIKADGAANLNSSFNINNIIDEQNQMINE